MLNRDATVIVVSVVMPQEAAHNHRVILQSDPFMEHIDETVRGARGGGHTQTVLISEGVKTDGVTNRSRTDPH